MIATNTRRRAIPSSATSSPAHPSRHAALRRRASIRTAGTAIVLPYPGLVRTAIANLQDHEFAVMSRGDLIDLVRLSALPFLSGDVCGRLEFLGEETLSKLAYLVRRCCRNQVDAHRRQRGTAMRWRETI